MYYLQSRYYDPEIGRFINADAFASTGQGLLGYNMFAYCLNNPVNYSDSGGNNATLAKDPRNIYMDGVNGVGTGSTGGYGLAILSGLIAGVGAVFKNYFARVSYAYREYTRSIKKTTEGLPPGNYPVTHHVIPYGEFSLRSDDVQDKLHEAQRIMRDAGVNPATDPINQLVLSATYHVSLHTDAYILMVTEPIIALGPNPSKNQIYAVLDDLRTIIAGNDPYAWGY